MILIQKLLARVRGLSPGDYPERRESEQLQVNPRGELLVSQGLPWLAEIVRHGDSWVGLGSGSTNSLTAIPTTTQVWTLTNGEPADGKCYVIDSVGYHTNALHGTQVNSTTMWCTIGKIPNSTTMQLGDGTTIYGSLSGKGGYAGGGAQGTQFYPGRARLQSSGAYTNDGWFPIGSSPPVPKNLSGSQWQSLDWRVDGLFIVQPGGFFGINITMAAASGHRLFIRWHEMKLKVF